MAEQPLTPELLWLAEVHSGVDNDPLEPYKGVAALFNGDLHRVDPDWAPREDWLVLSPYAMKHLPVGEVEKLE